MAEPVPPTGRVHWLGAGLSTGSGLRVLADRTPVTLWGRTRVRAEQGAERLGLTGGLTVRGLDTEDLDDQLRPGDVVVSMLPAGEHAGLLRRCLDRGAHFACSSYVSDELAALAGDAAARGLVVLAEAGLDPGIDHLLAHRLVAEAEAAVGADTAATASFTSYCGGIPAVPNEFRYRFSWAPRSVLTALRSPARYVEDGHERVVDEPWTATTSRLVGDERFEVYPNRDSVPFVEQYRMPPAWRLTTFVRGTVRLAGWLDAWAEVFPVLRAGDPAAVDALAARLAADHPMTAADRDRVILAVGLDVLAGDTAWTGEYVLDLVGDETETAMARTVSLPLARGVLDIVEGRSAPGPHRAVESGEDVDRWLEFLAGHGVTVRAGGRVPTNGD
ncbi:saccharopine dehydrogenase [Actinophytocola xinjiangensis]|uniref:Saccharopine dehydrogenase n=1 Tax=Actinophytocola xinjiangensis TaxID=485602 RepID=A0A7Z0WRV3_9PSEU|nr:saccharopine dehydrogenase C-terminal domain-containing protein [Actinophytocola xinjiangensis]OLF14130.1 saccharopine dehydrogenase [Actinophytocola xinjiangensis]